MTTADLEQLQAAYLAAETETDRLWHAYVASNERAKSLCADWHRANLERLTHPANDPANVVPALIDALGGRAPSSTQD